MSALTNPETRWSIIGAITVPAAVSGTFLALKSLELTNGLFKLAELGEETSKRISATDFFSMPQPIFTMLADTAASHSSETLLASTVFFGSLFIILVTGYPLIFQNRQRFNRQNRPAGQS